MIHVIFVNIYLPVHGKLDAYGRPLPLDLYMYVCLIKSYVL